MKASIYGAGALRGWRGHGLALTPCHLRVLRPRAMPQDVQTNKAVGLDALVTSMKQMGTLTQAPTPCSDARLGLARLQAQVSGCY